MKLLKIMYWELTHLECCWKMGQLNTEHRDISAALMTSLLVILFKLFKTISSW